MQLRFFGTTSFLSQKSTPALLLLSCALAFSSCSEFLRGKPKKADYIELQSDSLGCLGNVSTDVQNFFNSTSTDSSIDSTFTCLDGTLSEFQTRVEGRAESSAFNSDEIYDIFQKFVPDAHLSREAAKGILLLKSAILGGDRAKITKTEIGDLKKYLAVIKGEAKKLQPYLKLFSFAKTATPYSKNYIRDAFAQLNTSLKTLYRASNIASATYSFDDFKDLVINLNVLKNDQNSLVKVGTKLNLVLNGNISSYSEAERLAYIDNITEALRLCSVNANGYFDLSITSPGSITSSLDFLADVIRLLENSLQFKRTGIISASTIDALVTETVNSGLLSTNISAASAINFYKTVVVRVLESGVNGTPTISGVVKSHLTNLKRELAVYRIYSRFIERIAGPDSALLNSSKRISIAGVQAQLRAMSPASETDVLSAFDGGIQTQIVNEVEEMKAEFLAANPTIYRYKKMVIAANQDVWDQNWEDLATGLYNKMATRLLLVGWGVTPSSKEIKNSYMTSAGMTKWYGEFKAFGIALKIFDPRVDNLGASSFTAGNLFTRTGNGDDQLNFKETLENFGGQLSGGQAYALIRTDLEKNRCTLPQLDVMGEHWNGEACVLAVLRLNYRTYFASLSWLVAYLDTLNDANFKSFFQQLLNVARTDASNAGVRVESSDLTGMNTLLYFMEALYATHDLNRNWALSESEIKQGYPKFQNFATEFARKTSASQIKQFTGWEGSVAGYGCFSEADLIRESFVYLVYNGKTPGMGDLEVLPCFLGKPLLKFSGEVDRMRVLNAFKVIKSSLN